MNSVIIDSGVCKGCGLCIFVCPVQTLRQGAQRNAKGYLVPEADATRCTGCSTCEYVCPDMAISILATQGEGQCATK